MRQPREYPTDVSQAHDSESQRRRASQGAGVVEAPSTGAHGPVVERQMADHSEHHAEGVGRDLDEVRVRHVGDPNTACLGRCQINMVHTDADGGHETKPRQRFQDRTREGRGLDNKRIRALAVPDELLGRAAPGHVPFKPCLDKHSLLEIGIHGSGIGDQDLHVSILSFRDVYWANTEPSGQSKFQ